MAESFFSNLKNEWVHHCDFKTREEAKMMIFDYIECFYNRNRIHQSLGYRTPDEVERLYHSLYWRVCGEHFNISLFCEFVQFGF